MKKIAFNKAEFLLSALSELPAPLNYGAKPMPEIALIGRSNVGKSSLINHLLRNRSVAKVSATPGKTQLLNFFLIDEMLTLVDLPGYGYAKVPHQIKQKWGNYIDGYLKNRSNLSLLLVLLDSRHLPTNDDKAFIQWALHSNIPLLLVLTKMDKLKEREKSTQIKNIMTDLEKIGAKDLPFVTYTINDLSCRSTLIDKIHTLLNEFSWD
jgi:GTP-binding protein